MGTRPFREEKEEKEERGAGRDRSTEGLNATSPQLLFGGVSSDHKPLNMSGTSAL